jgi:hypothetical protein
MTTIDYALEGLTICISVSGLAIALAVYRRSVIDAYCQDLFILRNHLWEYAKDKGILNLPGHRELRDLLNSFIKLASLTNVLVVVPILLFTRSVPNERPIRSLIQDLPDEKDRQKLASVHTSAATMFLKVLFVHTFPGMLIGIPLLLLFKAVSLIQHIRRKLRDTEDQIVTHIVNESSFSRAERKVQRFGRDESATSRRGVYVCSKTA